MYSYYQDNNIRDYVERTFNIYDRDRSGALDIYEFCDFITDWFRNNGYHVTMCH